MNSTMMSDAPSTTARMRLADFILDNVEAILVHWEAFAQEIWPDQAEIDPVELRDHAEAILRATVADMRSHQTPDEQSDKSMGHDTGGRHSRRLDSASDLHGAGRVESGFKLKEVLAEYRALRASVLRLWRDSRPVRDAEDLDDLTRFHESIDQSLAQAVESFTERVDQSRRLFLAILGHDLRNPLNALTVSAQLLTLPDQDDPEAIVEAASVIAASARAMERMIGDLLDFTASGLGGKMPLSRASTDLQAICREVAEEIRATEPQCTLHHKCEGDLTGHWDATRLRQVVSNLLGNAVQHGGDGAGACNVSLSVRSEGSQVVLAVHNDGRPIPASALPTIFDPLRRLASGDLPRRNRSVGIGLGLYIAHQIVTSHGGTIDVQSTADAGTTFTACLPRQPPPGLRDAPDAVPRTGHAAT